jgi:sulfate adenylyltransferase subunit 1 (EFTu-like GTPase family)
MNAIVQQSTLATAQIPHRALLRVAIVGPAGHGKSALINRLLSETDNLADNPAGEGSAAGGRDIPAEWFLHTPMRDVVLIDAQAQGEFLRDTITGAAQADAAVLVLDAAEWAHDEPRLYGLVLQLLGVRQVIVAVNEMDRVAYDAGRFREIETEVRKDLERFGLAPTEVIPVSARDGDGIAEHTYTAEWYRPTLVEALDRLSPARVTREPRYPANAAARLDEH